MPDQVVSSVLLPFIFQEAVRVLTGGLIGVKWSAEALLLPEMFFILSKIIRLLRELIAEVSGGLVLMARVAGIFLAAMLYEGAMRLIVPLILFLTALVIYGLTCLIADKTDRH